jgi:hypothetical protein
MSVLVDENNNTILISADSNAISVTESGGIISVLDGGAGKIEVVYPKNRLSVSTPGIIGPAGPTGPSGITTVGTLDDLTDVLIISPADGDLLKYSNGLSTWTNSNKLDGGNF